MPPRIVVVIPCRDDADYLDACLSALDRQTRRPDAVIVVDNASTDATADVARAHGATLLREERVGIWPAAARGYDDAAASADIIARVDADSRPHPDWVARLERAFAERKPTLLNVLIDKNPQRKPQEFSWLDRLGRMRYDSSDEEQKK